MNRVSYTSGELAPGTIIVSGGESYEIHSLLGRGGMGVVYKATHLSLKRTVAIKMMSPQSQMTEALVQRMRTEARLCAALDHPNIVKVFSLGQTEGGELFLVLEYVEGETLLDRIAQNGNLTEEKFRKYFDSVLQALEAIHAKGLVHRDIKPSNLMVTADDTIKLMDFGIAKSFEVENAAGQALTQTGALIGSPWYMSPEQCAGEKLDARCDIYSLGCVMYECATGKQVFAGDNALEVMYKHVHEQLTTTSEVEIPFYGALIAKAMQKVPADRFQTAAEMRVALHGAQSERQRKQVKRTWLAYPRRMIAPAICILSVVLAATVWLLGQQEPPPKQQPISPTDLNKALNEATTMLNQSQRTFKPNEIRDLREKAKKRLQIVLSNLSQLPNEARLYAQLEWATLSDDTESARELWQKLRKNNKGITRVGISFQYSNWLFDKGDLDRDWQFIEGPLTEDMKATASTEAIRQPVLAGRKARILLQKGRAKEAGALLEPGSNTTEAFRDAIFLRSMTLYLDSLKKSGSTDRMLSLLMNCIPRAESFGATHHLDQGTEENLRRWIACSYNALLTELVVRRRWNDFDQWFSRDMLFSASHPTLDQRGIAHKVAATRYTAAGDLRRAIEEVQKARADFKSDVPRKAVLRNSILETYQLEFWWWWTLQKPETALQTIERGLNDPDARGDDSAIHHAQACQAKLLVVLHRDREAMPLLNTLVQADRQHLINEPTTLILTYGSLGPALVRAGKMEAAEEAYRTLFNYAREPAFRASNPNLMKAAELEYKELRLEGAHH